MKRRSFLAGLGLAGISPTVFSRTQSGFRKRGAIKKLLVIFQRGGNDGLNTVVPVESSQHAIYAAARGPVGFTQGGVTAIPGESFFGLNPGLAPLVPIYSAGHMAFLHGVSYPSADRSHFESESYYETAVPGNGLLDGWLNRYLQLTSGPGLVRGLAVGWNQPQSVLGALPVPISTNFGSISVGDDTGEGGAITSQVSSIYSGAATPGNSAIYQTGQSIFDMISNFSNRDANSYVPSNGATYPAGYFGSRMAHAAQMLKETPTPLNVEVVTLDQGGYDTHAQQVTAGGPTDPAGDHFGLLNDLASGLSAFYTDMGPAGMDDTVVLVISEFGRRLANNDLGTDHGIGTVAMVMGNAVNQQIHGAGASWPGLEQGNLEDGVDLAMAIDYRDIYWQIMSDHMGVDNATLANIIPGHTYSSLNLLS